MEKSRLKKFAQYARRSLIEQVGSKLKLVLATESQARREHPKTVSDLEKKRAELGESQLVEQVAYLWFNRLCALRFMDVNQYNRIMVISPLAGQFQPEILAEAKAGHIDESSVNEPTRKKVSGLLSGSIASRDGQSEAFRLLIVAVCNDLHRIMPYLFERIEDYTELLMPDDLLSGNSILAYTREAMTPEACESVESIGWLYQFYISEKKDEVFDGLKKNKKITPENIPAATQLFTPHWIVRYLVENSLGRLWMLNNPNSKVIAQMDYYIAPAAKEGEEQPAEVEEDFLRISSPEEIKICDPACGSGHMLTYAYDLLYAIYMDAGYDSAEIPERILTNNLFGIEIDERAAELAAFALTMKAVKGNPRDEGNNRRRFFRNPVEPNICRLEKVTFTDEELDSYIDFVGRDLITQDLRITLKEFEEADNFGSLIQPTLKTPEEALAALETKDVSGQLFLTETHNSVLNVLKQAACLSNNYHVVIANPPYMGGKGMNASLTKWAKDKYPNSKADLFSMFIERNLEFAFKQGAVAMITMQSWMFLSTFEDLRNNLLAKSNLRSMAHLGTRAFDSIGGEVVSTTAFVLENISSPYIKGDYLRLVDGKSEESKERNLLDSVADIKSECRFRVSALDFQKIPGNPIAYWISEKVRQLFIDEGSIAKHVDARPGLQTSDNARFLRNWQEVDFNKVGFECSSRDDSKESGKKWFPCNKGGTFRKWYGNWDFFVNWENDGEELFQFAKSLYGSPTRIIKNADYYFKGGITWSDITTGKTAFRFVPEGSIFDATGHCGFFKTTEEKLSYLAYLNTSLINEISKILNPTIHFHVGYFRLLPSLSKNLEKHAEIASKAVEISKKDWDAYETSWEFSSSPLLDMRENNSTLIETYGRLRSSLTTMVSSLHALEEENNRLLIDSYALQDEMDFSLPKSEVSLTCNPSFRYAKAKSEEEREALALADTLREFISYSVGCMFGRYSIDRKGLVLANFGNSVEDYLDQTPSPSFVPDDDNVIPLIDLELERGKQEDWFADDISERFKDFLKVTFGTENYDDNLRFIEEAIGKDIKKFFLKDFYADHWKRYKKRPIYWLFSSPKGSFNALIYMHRYRPDTVSVVLNDYLREFRTKLEARKASYEQVEVSASASQGEKTKAIKAIEKINKEIDEINDYERDILYPLASQNIGIDLDDGVKHNYPLFGKALKKVPGLS